MIQTTKDDYGTALSLLTQLKESEGFKRLIPLIKSRVIKDLTTKQLELKVFELLYKITPELNQAINADGFKNALKIMGYYDEKQ